MKRRFYIFTALAALAAAVCISMNGWLIASADGFAVTGELMLGERDEAEGIGVAYSAALTSGMNMHYAVEIDTVYDAGTGGSESSGRWRTGLERHEAEPSFHLSARDALLGRFEWNGSGNLEEVFASSPDVLPIAEELFSRSDGSGTVISFYPLSGFCDFIPMQFSCGSFTYAGEDAPEDVFRVSAGDAELEAGLISRTALNHSLYLSVPGVSVSSDSAFGGDWLYFVLDVRDESGALLDGSLLPGGDWGVYRIPCDGGALDPGGAENILPLPEGWLGADLELSADGGTLFVLTRVGGEVKLLLLDLASLELRQSVTVLDEADFEAAGLGLSNTGVGVSLFRVTEGGVAVSVRDLAAGYAFSDGLCTEVYTGTTAFEQRPERFEPGGFFSYGWGPVDIACDGERLIVLREIHNGPYYTQDGGEIMARGCALLIFGPGGLEYLEFLTTPFDLQYYSHGYYTASLIPD